MMSRLSLGGLVLAVMFWVLSAAPAVLSPVALADEPMKLSGTGDVSVPRTEAEVKAAFKAHGILIKALTKQDAESLLVAAKLMAQLSDPIGVSDEEIAFAAAVSLRPAPAKASNASTDRVVVLNADDVLQIALQIAKSKGNQALIDDIRAEQKAFADRPKDDTRPKRQACTYGNCCGYKGCWEDCQWW